MTDPTADRGELVRGLLEPDAYPNPAPVELRETHISWVFLVGSLAYKVKKPVVLPFLDYGTPERRREMCREEVRLNRRLAPRIYLGVVGIVRDDGGYRVADEGDPAAIEYAVEMRRVDADRSLAALAAAGRLEPAHVVQSARLLARFHAAAQVAPAQFADVGVLERTIAENNATLREHGAGVIAATRIEAMERYTRAFLDAHRDELAARARDGLVRDCHGDLRAEHVIVPASGDAYVYDCVEFDPALRCIDVAADLAFLVMDLTALGAAPLAGTLVDEYRAAGGDPGGDALVSFFAAYRAWVRAKVACLRAEELGAGDPRRAAAHREAVELSELGHRFAWRSRGPLVLAVCGLPASGKSTLARALADASGWEHVASDVVRKRRAGLRPTERGGPELYSRKATLATYRALGAAASERVAGGDGVIVDATFHRREERDAFRSAVTPADVPIVFVRCEAPLDVLRARIRKRAERTDRVSDADERILERHADELEPLDEVPDDRRLSVATDRTGAAELVARVEAGLDAVA